MQTTFKVTINDIRATNLTPKDKDGFSDPYVEIKFGGEVDKFKTDHIENELNPSWDWGVTFFWTTSFGHRLDKKIFKIKVVDHNRMKRDVTIGKAQIDLFTVATGPRDFDLVLLENGTTPAGRVQFQCEMVQVCDGMSCMLSDLEMPDWRQVQPPGSATDPGGRLFLEYFFSETEDKTVQSEEVGTTQAVPTWASNLPYLRFKASVDQLDLAYVIVLVKMKSGYGSLSEFGRARIPLLELYSPESAVPVAFDVPVSRLDSRMREVPSGRLTGKLLTMNGPKFAQMLGGKSSELGVEPGEIFAPGFPAPTRCLSATSVRDLKVSRLPRAHSSAVAAAAAAGAPRSAAPLGSPGGAPRAPVHQSSSPSPMGTQSPPVVYSRSVPSTQSPEPSVSRPAAAPQQQQPNPFLSSGAGASFSPYAAASTPVGTPYQAQTSPAAHSSAPWTGVAGSGAPATPVRAAAAGAALPGGISWPTPAQRPKRADDDLAPLPRGWGLSTNKLGHVYFKFHATRQTSWQDPRFLPHGWEQLVDDAGQLYFVRHGFRHRVTVDPRGVPDSFEVSVDPTNPSRLVFVDKESGVSTPLDPRGLDSRRYSQHVAKDGRVYFRDHVGKKTQWEDPRELLSPAERQALLDAQIAMWWDARWKDVRTSIAAGGSATPRASSTGAGGAAFGGGGRSSSSSGGDSSDDEGGASAAETKAWEQKLRVMEAAIHAKETKLRVDREAWQEQEQRTWEAERLKKKAEVEAAMDESQREADARALEAQLAKKRAEFELDWQRRLEDARKALTADEEQARAKLVVDQEKARKAQFQQFDEWTRSFDARKAKATLEREKSDAAARAKLNRDLDEFIASMPASMGGER